MLNKKTSSVIDAFDESFAIFDRELDELTDKIANDTITPDEQRHYDRLIRIRSELGAQKVTYIATHAPNQKPSLFRKFIAPLAKR